MQAANSIQYVLIFIESPLTHKYLYIIKNGSQYSLFS